MNGALSFFSWDKWALEVIKVIHWTSPEARNGCLVNSLTMLRSNNTRKIVSFLF